jgi:hypothetical protein
MPWTKPLHWLWRSALRQADLVSAAGPNLAALMRQGQEGKNSVVVPMAADPTGFEPRDKMECRQALELPVDAPLVAYCGPLHRTRGADVLFDAIDHLSGPVSRSDEAMLHSGPAGAYDRLVRSLHAIERDQPGGPSPMH